MKKIITEDKSITFYNDEFDETYHSTTGAVEEAFEKYVKPLEVADGMTILDFCYGLGYNSAAAMSVCKNLQITAIEIDREIVGKSCTIDIPEELVETYRYLCQLLGNNPVTDAKGNLIHLIIDDALVVMHELKPDTFERVFFDPFSPQKHPDMWTEDVFLEMYRIMKKGGKLATYSCSKRVRRAMASAGFTVIDGPCIGRRSPSTIAVKPSA